MGNPRNVFIIQISKYILHILLKSHTQNYHPTNLRKWMGGRWLGDLPKNCVICIEKEDPNSFAQVTTILGNLYRKPCLLTRKI